MGEFWDIAQAIRCARPHLTERPRPLLMICDRRDLGSSLLGGSSCLYGRVERATQSIASYLRDGDRPENLFFMFCVFDGLTQRRELNGNVGVIQSWNPASHNFHVRLAGSLQTVDASPACLVEITDPRYVQCPFCRVGDEFWLGSGCPYCDRPGRDIVDFVLSHAPEWLRYEYEK